MDDLKIRLVLEGAEQVQAGANKAADGVQRLGRNSQQAGQQAQLSGQQMAQVSAQLQDLFIQIQAGQAPITALLQQGSQLTTVFGGVGGALRAVGGFASTLINPLTLAGAAVGALGLAYLQGRSESEAYNRSLILTGNAAGVTAGQLQAMASAQSGLGITQRQAAEALAALAATGAVSAASLKNAADAAARLAAVGVPLEDTVKKFAALGKDPLKALVRLNEEENFLTAAVYQQVKALEDRGRVAEAAYIAQEEYARVGAARSKQLAEQLGFLEKAWASLSKVAGEAWGRMLNLAGREGSPQQALDKVQEQIRDAQRKIDEARSGELNRNRPFVDAARVAAAQEVALKGLLAEEQALQEVLRLELKSADAKALRAAEVKRLIKADEDAAKAAKESAAERARENVAIERAIGLSGTYGQTLSELQQLRQRGLVTEQQYIAAVQRLIQEQPMVREQLQAQAEAQRQAARALDDALKAEQRRLDATYRTAEQLAANVLKLQEEEKAVQLSAAANMSLAEAIERVTIARLEEVQAQATAAGDYGTAAALRAEIEAREKLATMIGRKEARETAKRSADDAAREWKRAASDIERSLTDALLRGFESGKGFGANLRDTLVNMFKTLVLRPVIEPVVGQFANSIQGWLGLAQSAAGLSGGAGSSGLNLSQAGALASWFGSGLGVNGASGAAAYSSGFGAAGAGGGASASSSAAALGWVAAAVLGAMKASSDYSEGYNVSGARDVTASIFAGSSFGPETARAGLLSSLGVSDRWASILSGSTAIAKLFGRAAPKVQASGVDGSFQAGDFSGQAFADMYAKGGLFRRSKSWTEWQAIPAELASVLDSGAKAVMSEAQAYAKVLGLPAEKLLAVNSQARLTFGADNEANQKAIVDALAAYGTALAEGYKQELAAFAKAGETSAATIARLAGLQVFSGTLNTLGGVFSRLANASVSAREQLIALAGGMDSLGQQALGFAQNYYGREEIAGLKARDVQQALGAAGISADVNTREQFRALVESLDPNTTTGRQQLAALLQLQGSFATLADYLTETGLTLSQAAAQAPVTDALLSPLLSNTGQQLQLAQQSMDAQYETRDATLQVVEGTQRIVDGLERLAGALSAGGGRISGSRPPEVGLAY